MVIFHSYVSLLEGTTKHFPSKKLRLWEKFLVETTVQKTLHELKESAWRHWKTPFLEMSKRRVLLIPSGGIRKKKRRVEPRRYNNSVAGSSHCEQLINPGDALRPKGRPACIEAWWGHWNLWIFVRVTCRFDPCCLRATPEDLSRFW